MLDLVQLNKFGKILSAAFCYLLAEQVGLAQNTTDPDKTYHERRPPAQVSFAAQVAPILQKSCAGCHSQTAKMGGFVLTSFEGLMQGGSHGQAVVPGDAKSSRLVQMVEGTVQPRMPMGEELGAEEILLIRQWVEQGAKLDRNPGNMEALKEPEIPQIKSLIRGLAQTNAVAFSSDGSILAAGGYGEVTFFHSATGKRLGTLTGFTEGVRTVVFSPNGQWLAAGAGRPGQQGEIKIWKVEEEFWSQPARHTISAHRDCVYALAFAPDSNLLASVSYDQMIYLWDATTGKQVKQLKEHTDAIFDTAFSPDGKWLASGGADRTVKLWDVASGQRLLTLGSATEGVTTLAFHPMGNRLVCSGFDRTLRVWDLTGVQPVEVQSAIAHEDTVLRLALSPDGTRLVTASSDKSIKIWDAARLVLLQVLPHQADWVLSLGFSRDGTRLAAGRFDGSISLYETNKFSVARELVSPSFREQASVSQ